LEGPNSCRTLRKTRHQKRPAETGGRNGASIVRAEQAVPPDKLAATAHEKLKARVPVPRAKAQGNIVLGTVISNPDKMLGPADDKNASYSKLDLAHYLERIGPWMIEHLRGRLAQSFAPWLSTSACFHRAETTHEAPVQFV